MTAVVVATARSRRGGTCAGCGERVAPGEPVCKVDTGDRGAGTSTKFGNGPGAWLCLECTAAAVADNPE